MKKTYKVQLNIKSKRIQTLLRRCAGAYRKSYNIATEFQFNATLLRGSLQRFLSGTQVLQYLSKFKDSYSFLKDLDKGIYTAAVFAAVKAFNHKFDFHIENIPFLSRKKSKILFKTVGNVRVTPEAVILPKVGRISLCERGRIPSAKRYSNVTISFDGNHWFISLEVEERLPQMELSEEVVTLDFTNSGDFLLNGELLPSPVKSSRYTREERKLKKAMKKLKRQTITNTKTRASGRNVVVTTKNMKKTQKFVDKKRVRLYNMRKDCLFKVVNGVAITKPKELHILSNSSLRAQRNNLMSRAQLRGGSADFLRMMSKRLGIIGTRVLRHVSAEEFPQLSPRL